MILGVKILLVILLSVHQGLHSSPCGASTFPTTTVPSRLHNMPESGSVFDLHLPPEWSMSVRVTHSAAQTNLAAARRAAAFAHSWPTRTVLRGRTTAAVLLCRCMDGAPVLVAPYKASEPHRRATAGQPAGDSWPCQRRASIEPGIADRRAGHRQCRVFIGSARIPLLYEGCGMSPERRVTSRCRCGVL